MDDPEVSRMRVELIQLRAGDGRLLEGLLYEPQDGERVIASTLHIHGKGGNCYSGTSRQIPEHALGRGIRHLSLNMRCHDLGYTRTDLPYADFEAGGETAVDGGYWEKLHLGRTDIDAGVEYLRARGPEPVFVTGISSGGFYVADYCAAHERIAGRVLISPVLSNLRSIRFWFPSEKELLEATQVAQLKVESGNGHHLIPVDRWYYAISSSSLLERLEESSEAWSSSVNSSDSPLLMIWGSEESRAPQWQAAFDGLTVEQKEACVISGADHSFFRHGAEPSGAIADFVLSRCVSG